MSLLSLLGFIFGFTLHYISGEIIVLHKSGVTKKVYQGPVFMCEEKFVNITNYVDRFSTT